MLDQSILVSSKQIQLEFNLCDVKAVNECHGQWAQHGIDVKWQRYRWRSLRLRQSENDVIIEFQLVRLQKGCTNSNCINANLHKRKLRNGRRCRRRCAWALRAPIGQCFLFGRRTDACSVDRAMRMVADDLESIVRTTASWNLCKSKLTQKLQIQIVHAIQIDPNLEIQITQAKKTKFVQETSLSKWNWKITDLSELLGDFSVSTMMDGVMAEAMGAAPIVVSDM